MVDTFNGWIDNASKITTDKTSIKNNARWWTQELKALRKNARKARKEYQTVRCNGNIDLEDDDEYEGIAEAKERCKVANRTCKKRSLKPKNTLEKFCHIIN